MWNTEFGFVSHGYTYGYNSDVQIYINDEFIGAITKKYSSEPKHEAVGCVVYKTNESSIFMNAKSIDGYAMWPKRKIELNKKRKKVCLDL